MLALGINTALLYVRRALDELTDVERKGMLGASDDNDLKKLVEGHLSEAAVRIHLSAPSVMLDGVMGELGEDYTATLDSKVVTITMNKETIRVASIQMADSDYVISDFIPEDSAEGRKQLNKYVRGIPDDPRVVLQKKWAGENLPVLKYYTTNLESLGNDSISVEYIPYPYLKDHVIHICPRLEYAVLNELTAMVLESLSLNDKAAAHRAKAQENIQGK